MDVVKNGHELFLDARWANLPFLPCFFPERSIMKTRDSAEAPFEIRDTLIADLFLYD